MESHILQDWTTIRGSGTTAVVQSANQWLDAAEFSDATFWLDVRESTNPGAGTISLSFETAPIKDDALFQAMTTLSSGSPWPKTAQVLLNNGPLIPLGRYLRWKLVGTQAGMWDITFRVYVTFGVGAPAAYSPLALPGLLLWLRADKGITLNGNNVSGWADQSGNGNDASQGTAANQPPFVASSIGGRPSVNFSGTTWLQNTLTNLVSAGSIYSVLAVAQNGSGPLFSIRLSPTYSATYWYQVTGVTWVHGDGINTYSSVTVANTTSETQSSTNAFKSCHRFNGGGTWPDVYLNGTQRAITSGAPPTTRQTIETGTTTGFAVGYNMSPVYWGGLISEIIVTSNAIAASDRQKVEAYQSLFFGF